MLLHHVPIILEIAQIVTASPGVFIHEERFAGRIPSMLAQRRRFIVFPFPHRPAEDMLFEPLGGGISLAIHIAWRIHIRVLDRAMVAVQPPGFCRHALKGPAITRLIAERPHHHARMTPFANDQAAHALNRGRLPLRKISRQNTFMIRQSMGFQIRLA